MDQQLTNVQIKLINILEEYFRKSTSAETHPISTTDEIFRKLQSIFPSQEYTHEDVLQVMRYGAYETLNSSTGAMYWFIQEKP